VLALLSIRTDAIRKEKFRSRLSTLVIVEAFAFEELEVDAGWV